MSENSGLLLFCHTKSEVVSGVHDLKLLIGLKAFNGLKVFKGLKVFIGFYWSQGPQ